MAMTQGTLTMRLDRFLWFVRVVKKREWAQAMAAAGTLRIDGRRIERAACPVRVGDTLTFMANERVRVIRVLALPTRRGPATEAQACYAELTSDPLTRMPHRPAPPHDLP